MSTPPLVKHLCLLLAVVAPGAAVVLAGDQKLPATEQAEPAIDPAKLAGDAALRVKDAKNRTTSVYNLKSLGLAMHNYAGIYNGRLPGNIESKEGKALLSWRVSLLPYLEEFKLYKEFKLDEPWDSANNIKLLEGMPKVYESPRVTVKRKGYTVYQTFFGPEALFRAGGPKYKIGNIPDGTSNTIFAVESSAAVPWTKPADIPFDAKKDLPDFGKAFGQKALGALMDGSVRTLDLKKLTAQTLKNAIVPDDGNPIGTGWSD